MRSCILKSSEMTEDELQKWLFVPDKQKDFEEDSRNK